MRYCYKCGTPNDKKANFCGNCGTSMYPNFEENIQQTNVSQCLEANSLDMKLNICKSKENISIVFISGLIVILIIFFSV